MGIKSERRKPNSRNRMMMLTDALQCYNWTRECRSHLNVNKVFLRFSIRHSIQTSLKFPSKREEKHSRRERIVIKDGKTIITDEFSGVREENSVILWMNSGVFSTTLELLMINVYRNILMCFENFSICRRLTLLRIFQAWNFHFAAKLSMNIKRLSVIHSIHWHGNLMETRWKSFFFMNLFWIPLKRRRKN